MQAVEASSPEPQGSRVTYHRPEFDEWYDNTCDGLEQGFTVHESPAGKGPLCLAGRVTSALRAEISLEEGALDLLDEHGARVLRSGELHVWDAAVMKCRPA
jgi:hypothetical protein